MSAVAQTTRPLRCASTARRRGSPWARMPRIVLRHIFAYLDGHDLERASLVCNRTLMPDPEWSAAVDDQIGWRETARHLGYFSPDDAWHDLYERYRTSAQHGSLSQYFDGLDSFYALFVARRRLDERWGRWAQWRGHAHVPRCLRLWPAHALCRVQRPRGQATDEWWTMRIDHTDRCVYAITKSGALYTLDIQSHKILCGVSLVYFANRAPSRAAALLDLAGDMLVIDRVYVRSHRRLPARALAQVPPFCSWRRLPRPVVLRCVPHAALGS